MEAFLLGMILRVWKRRLKKHYLTMLRLKTLHQRIKTTLWNPLVANMILRSSKLSRLSIWWTKSRRRNMIYPLLKFRTLIKSTKNFTPNIKSNKIMLNKTRQEELWEKETRIRP
jgi:expansin (peptidoglycan-binding protein)